MEVSYVLIGISFLMAGMGLGAFFWSVRAGQFDDLESPAERMIVDEDTKQSTDFNLFF